MRLSNFFDEEAVGGEGSASSEKSTIDKQDDHDDVEIGGGGGGYISNNDDPSNAEIGQEIIDDNIEELPPVIPDHQSVIQECLHEAFKISNPKA